MRLNEIKPDIDLICANYNNSPYLADFFNSIIHSSIRPNKVIFVDDASKDNSIDICQEYSNHLPELFIVKLPRNVGFANALNIGLSQSNSKYILRIDPDDLLAPNRIELQFNYLENNPEIDAVGSQATYFHSESGEILNRTRMPIGTENINAAYLNCDNGVLHGTTLIRRSAIGNIKYRQEDVPSEDYSLFGRLLSSGAKFANIDIPLTLVRVHGSSVSNDIKYSTILKVHNLRSEIFGIPRSRIFTVADYTSMKHYRRYLYCQSSFKRGIHLFIAALFAPRKTLRRILEYVK